MTDDFPTRFDHRSAEEKWYARWEQSGAFRAGARGGAEPYTMVIPPPNVTGALHMGHALNNTIQDIYARYNRMRGRDVLWLPGTDHAGIATQNVVEKQLAKEKIRRDDIGREEFVRRVWKWKEESGGTIVRQLRRLGASCDWSRERFTMDEGLSRAVVEVFVRLHEEGLIYRADRLVNWCTRCRTALSDIEVEHADVAGHFWHVRYAFADGSGHVEIATTRPETMLGDTAVAVHPEDERYAGVIGKELILPLVGRRIPLIADKYVDREFGTGAVKITPGHDPNDYEIGLRHSLLMIKAFTDRGRIAETILERASSDSTAKLYIGMKLADCRKAVVEDLEAAGLLVRVEDHRHSVGHCYRCRTAIEPFLTPQWFVKTGPLAAEAMAAVEQGRTRIVPEHWSKTYFEWMRNIRDWCISRQIWWGHQIPAWYCRRCDAGRITSTGPETLLISSTARPVVARSKPEQCPRCGSDDLIRDPDVLDTWFSSALWPFSTLGWPDKTADLTRYYPTNLLVTGFDILFFWVARMMMMGLHFMKEVPFREVYIHALVRDSEGKKMSKSKGNVIDPLAVIDDLGSDAFRFTLAAFCAQGRDIKLDERRIEGYRNFVTKIWNAARLVLGHCEERSDEAISSVKGDCFAPPDGGARNDLRSEDAWILSRLSAAVTAATDALDRYHLDKAADAIYSFFWHEFCDWYLEIAKPRLRENDPAALATARRVLEQSVLLMHPFMPHVTDELNERMGGADFLDDAQWPARTERDAALEDDFDLLIEVVTEIRRMRTEFRVPPAQRLKAHLVTDKPIAHHESTIRLMAQVEDLQRSSTRPKLTHFASGVVKGIEILLPLEGIIDMEAERKRLGVEIEECGKQVAASKAKLADKAFAERAPEEIVVAVKATLAEREERRKKLSELLENL